LKNTVGAANSANGANAGIGFLLVSLACFALLDTLTKQVTLHVHVFMVVWARYVIQALVTTAFILPRRGLGVISTTKPSLQVLRGALLLLCTTLAAISLMYLPIGEFSAIVMTTPLVVTLLAARVLGEHVSKLRLGLVVGGLAGTLLIMKPGTGTFGWIILLPLLLVFVNTAFQLLTGKIAQTENSLTTHFYSVWVGAALSTVLLLWGWVAIADPYLWGKLVLIGATGALGHFLLVLAFEKSATSTLMPYMYAQIGFGMLAGWLGFDHIPDRVAMLGIAIIAVCGIAGGILTSFEGRKSAALASPAATKESV
jgi:drug/metabolite transporter (DMT)-like permease